MACNTFEKVGGIKFGWLIGGWTAYELYKSETNDERLEVVKATAHGFVWPAGVFALKLLGATHPVLMVGNVVGAIYTFKDLPGFIYGFFKDKKEEEEVEKKDEEIKAITAGTDEKKEAGVFYSCGTVLPKKEELSQLVTSPYE